MTWPGGWWPTWCPPHDQRRCQGVRLDGQRCLRWAMRGEAVCHLHLSPPLALHGTLGMYRSGCTCDACRRCEATRRARYRRQTRTNGDWVVDYRLGRIA